MNERVALVGLNSLYRCFPAGTKIIVDKVERDSYGGIRHINGSISIEQINMGDRVLSYNEVTGDKELKDVISIYRGESKEFFIIRFSNGNYIETTLEHPIAIDNDGKVQWVMAKDLSIGMSCMQLLYPGLSLRERGNFNTGKTYEEIYGEKLGSRMRKNAGHQFKNRTLIDMYGERIANKIKNAAAKIRQNRSWKEQFGNDKATEMSNNHSKRIIELHEDTNSVYNSVEYRKKLSDSLSIVQKNKMISDPNYADKQLRNLYKGGVHPNKSELLFQEYLNIICPDEFEINADGRVEKRSGISFSGHRPDFVDINGKKKIILYNGCQWHLCPYHIRRKEYKYIHDWTISSKDSLFHDLEEADINMYKSLGYDCLIIWEHEMPKFSFGKLDEAKAIELISKIRNFIYNPNIKLVKVCAIERKIFESKVVYNLEVKDNNNFFANGILTHNCGASSVLLHLANDWDLLVFNNMGKFIDGYDIPTDDLKVKVNYISDANAKILETYDLVIFGAPRWEGNYNFLQNIKLNKVGIIIHDSNDFIRMGIGDLIKLYPQAKLFCFDNIVNKIVPKAIRLFQPFDVKLLPKYNSSVRQKYFLCATRFSPSKHPEIVANMVGSYPLHFYGVNRSVFNIDNYKELFSRKNIFLHENAYTFSDIAKAYSGAIATLDATDFGKNYDRTQYSILESWFYGTLSIITNKFFHEHLIDGLNCLELNIKNVRNVWENYRMRDSIIANGKLSLEMHNADDVKNIILEELL